MPLLRPDDCVRFVSPASPVEREAVERRAEVLRDWGLRVEVAAHAFDRLGYLAGEDDARLADLADALLDPVVHAVFATRGGKGSYRIAHRLPFAAIAHRPKPLIGFSDITALHLALWQKSGAIGVHSALTGNEADRLSGVATASLQRVLMSDDAVVVAADPAIASGSLTTTGRAMGPLIGGNLTMIATAAGWALPTLAGAILLIESNDLFIGQFHRFLTMLVRAGHLDGIAGIAVGHLVGTPDRPPFSAMSLLREHLAGFGVPILGGLPIGHHADARTVLIGAKTVIDADAGTLIQDRAR
ncbi:LD-carboxypeptidase [Jiella sp. CQZ9-1]|uniref:LD-carboxypeptidase n=2 Tax=Jiella flava TaxID=2816857 RepID=A0A939JX72_9HYPH|nr:LD-carboxypeptidase [Jiella flava]